MERKGRNHHAEMWILCCWDASAQVTGSISTEHIEEYTCKTEMLQDWKMRCFSTAGEHCPHHTCSKHPSVPGRRPLAHPAHGLRVWLATAEHRWPCGMCGTGGCLPTSAPPSHSPADFIVKTSLRNSYYSHTLICWTMKRTVPVR